MFAKINSLGIIGIDAYPVTVEVDFQRGMPVFEIVGLPDTAVKESRDRVKAALGNCSLELPPGRIVVNLAPADVRKIGSLYDLPILIGLLRATGQIESDMEDSVLLGELSLSGELRPVSGTLSMALEAQHLGFRRLFLPASNAAEGAAAQGLDIYPLHHIRDLLLHLSGKKTISPMVPLPFSPQPEAGGLDFCDVKGQLFARRAAEIAAAGGHSLLMVGSPGSGKSMIAQRIPSILPPLSLAEALETTRIHSVAGLLPPGEALVRTRPFRAPHHTVSPAGLVGGGSTPRPGEISLAHNGVLFLDELPEFSRTAMEVLRQPVENGELTISRANCRVRYPSRFMLVAAMNPCPCGYYGHPSRACTCPPSRVAAYLNRISGPLLDRMDLHVEVEPVEFDQLYQAQDAEPSHVIRARVIAARERQLTRTGGFGASCNALLSPSQVRTFCSLSQEAKGLLKSAFDAMGLSARAYERILKVSRTIADLAGCETIEAAHVAEAVQYRGLDRKYWGHDR